MLWTLNCALSASVNAKIPANLVSVLGAAKSDIVVAIRRIIPVAIGAPYVLWIVEPRAAPQHPLL